MTFMNTRLKQFLAAENISQSQFADTIKVVRASVSHVLSGRNNPGYDFIKAIMTAYPALNMEWLILGKGKMYRENASDSPAGVQVPNSSSTDDAPCLFDESSFVENSVPFVPEYMEPIQPNILPQTQSFARDNKGQTTINQRKVIKVTIFFDDGTYQDM